MMTSKLVGIEDLERLAEELVKASQGVKIWLFFGEIGSGKTTLIRHVCVHLGITDSVSSPTFAIVNEYWGKAGLTIYHLDLFRLKKTADAHRIGVEEYFDSGAYCFVEWPDTIVSITPATYFKVAIKTASLSKRMVDYTLTT